MDCSVLCGLCAQLSSGLLRLCCLHIFLSVERAVYFEVGSGASRATSGRAFRLVANLGGRWEAVLEEDYKGGLALSFPILHFFYSRSKSG